MTKSVKLKFYCVCKDEDNNFELWAGPCSSKPAALNAGEMKLLETFGSRSKKYAKRVNNLVAVNESEARYLKLA